jgi:hypothetical protein
MESPALLGWLASTARRWASSVHICDNQVDPDMRQIGAVQTEAIEQAKAANEHRQMESAREMTEFARLGLVLDRAHWLILNGSPLTPFRRSWIGLDLNYPKGRSRASLWLIRMSTISL